MIENLYEDTHTQAERIIRANRRFLSFRFGIPTWLLVSIISAAVIVPTQGYTATAYSYAGICALLLGLLVVMYLYTLDSEPTPKKVRRLVEWFQTQNLETEEMDLLDSRAKVESSSFPVRALLPILVLPLILSFTGNAIGIGVDMLFVVVMITFVFSLGLKEIVERVYQADFIQSCVPEYRYLLAIKSRSSHELNKDEVSDSQYLPDAIDQKTLPLQTDPLSVAPNGTDPLAIEENSV